MVLLLRAIDAGSLQAEDDLSCLEALLSSKFHDRAVVAALTRSREPNDPELIEARRKLRESSLADVIRKAVSEAPPLQPEQVDRLVVLLRGGAHDAA